MRTACFPPVFVSVFLLVYAVLAFLQKDTLVTLMFLVSPVLVVWMVVRVLKDGKPSGKTFEDHFYEDMDDRRFPGGD